MRTIIAGKAGGRAGEDNLIVSRLRIPRGASYLKSEVGASLSSPEFTKSTNTHHLPFPSQMLDGKDIKLSEDSAAA